MSLPSYQLSKNAAGVWECVGKMPSGRPFMFEAGSGTRDHAVGAVEAKLRQKMASSTGSKARWAKQKAAGGSPSPPPPASTEPAAPRMSAEELRAKLLGLGDQKPIAADGVIPPGPDGQPAGAPPDEEETADDMDTEGQELIASLLAKGATLGLVHLANRPLRKRKPPQEGEAHEKGLEYFHDGIEHVAKKIVGKTATLGPTAKIFVGAAIIVGSVYMTAEPIPGAAPTAEPAPPPTPPPVEKHATNGAPPSPPVTTLARTGLPLGTFGVEKQTIGN